MIRDEAEGRGSHQLDIAWHIGPTLSLSRNEHLFSDESGSLALLTAEGHGWSQNVNRDYWSPAYGKREYASVVHFSAISQLPTDFVTLLIADDKQQVDRGRLLKVNDSNSASVRAYRYSTSKEEHSFFFAFQSGPWVFGAWASDADFLYWAFDRKKEQCMLVLCNGSYADAAGRRVITCGKRVRYAEILSSDANVEILSSDPGQVELKEPLDRVCVEENQVVHLNDTKGTGV
jgi:hypothetical protein